MSEHHGTRRASNGKPTIDDVARLAGVSRTSVSRVLNNGPNVRPSLREKVTNAVERLGYEVNIQARSLAGGLGGQVTLLHQSDLNTEPNSYYHSALELGALRACAAHGFQLVTQTISPDRAVARDQIRSILGKDWVAGILVTPPLSDDTELVKLVARSGKPLVGISAATGGEDSLPSIGIDDFEAGRDIASYLISIGHRKFGYIHGPPDHISAELRYRGLLAALREAEIAEPVAEVQGDFTFHSGITCAQAIISLADRPTAIVCANDDMAAGALLAIHRAGLSIPGDISITGFDDTPLSEIVWPPLTTIHQPLKDIGLEAAEMLIGLIGKEAGRPCNPPHQLAKHYLVARESTGSPPS